MKLNLLYLGLLLTSCIFTGSLFGQADAKPVKYTYCVIDDHIIFLTKKVEIEVEDGKEDLYKNRLIRDEKGETIKFNSLIDGLNYMVDKGWELFQVYNTGQFNDDQYMILRKQKEN